MIYDSHSDHVNYSYTRKPAIADCVLLDLSNNEAVKQHWKQSPAYTSAVWGTTKTAISEEDCDLNGIIHDISVLAKVQIRNGTVCAENTVHFIAKIGKRTYELKLHIGPGDEHEPVLTLMFADED